MEKAGGESLTSEDIILIVAFPGGLDAGKICFLNKGKKNGWPLSHFLDTSTGISLTPGHRHVG